MTLSLLSLLSRDLSALWLFLKTRTGARPRLPGTGPQSPLRLDAPLFRLRETCRCWGAPAEELLRRQLGPGWFPELLRGCLGANPSAEGSCPCFSKAGTSLEHERQASARAMGFLDPDPRHRDMDFQGPRALRLSSPNPACVLGPRQRWHARCRSEALRMGSTGQMRPALHCEILILKERKYANEIMHHDISPLCAADIQDQLQKRFAYLSGGRGQDGSPVITFPDYPAFGDVPDKEFQNVMTYLTSIPSWRVRGRTAGLLLGSRRGSGAGFPRRCLQPLRFLWGFITTICQAGNHSQASRSVRVQMPPDKTGQRSPFLVDGVWQASSQTAPCLSCGGCAAALGAEDVPEAAPAQLRTHLQGRSQTAGSWGCSGNVEPLADQALRPPSTWIAAAGRGEWGKAAVIPADARAPPGASGLFSPSCGRAFKRDFVSWMNSGTPDAGTNDAGIGFILVIDRRQDKWTSVKASILRIASDVGVLETPALVGWSSPLGPRAAAGVGTRLAAVLPADRAAALCPLQASFPANLQLVLVLRPTGFFQRTLSDLAFRFNRDDFKMKVPVIMLSSVPELHSYIDKSQLTEDLGGTLDYCHSRWLCHRTAIESFALLVKQTAQMLQAFGTELAETELPNDVQSTSSVLHAHTEKKDRAKEDMRLALDEGRSVLESIREPLARGPEQSPNQDQLDSQSTVQRLLAQLSETEAAFDEFWAKHQRKLEQCLQLRHFEQDFREVKAALDVLAQKITTFTDVGNSLAHVQHLLKDLASFEEKSSAVTQRARTLALEGERLIELKHYAVDSIRPKCHELRQLCDQFAADVGRRRGLLGRALDLHSLLEASMKWCDEGIYLLASQPVDKCQAQDGAEAALQEVEKFLETRAENKIQELSKIYQDYEPILTRDLLEHVQKVFRKQESVEEMFHRRQASLKKLAAKQTRPVQPVAPRPEAPAKSPCPSPGIRRGSEIHSSEGSVLRRGPYRRARSEVSEGRQGRGRSTGDEESLAVLRRHVMNELLDTERVYVEELLCILEGYAAEMDNPLMTHLISTGLQNKKDVLFGNMEEIYHFHNRIFLRELENYIDCPELVGRCFLERMEQFQVYEKYCQNKPRSESLWRQCSDCPFFQVCLLAPLSGDVPLLLDSQTRESGSRLRQRFWWLQECQKKLDHKLSLDSYLLKPVQRITKYQLLLKEMLKYSKSCEGAEDLQEALSSILGILKAVNDSMHLIAITGYEGNLSDLGKLLMQGSFSVWTDHKKGHAKVKDLARFKPMQRHLFLHEKAVLFCKKREENGEGYEKAPSYSFKQSLNMTAVGITENVKGDAKKFEIWYNAREEVYIVQAPTPEIKAAWVSEIRKVLTSQLQACRAPGGEGAGFAFLSHAGLLSPQRPASTEPWSSPTACPCPRPPAPGEAWPRVGGVTSGSQPMPPGLRGPVTEPPGHRGRSGERPWGHMLGNTKDVRKLEERKTDPLNLEGYVGPAPLPRPPEKDRDDAVTSSTSESSALSKKRFTLQSFAALKGQKASPTSPDKKAKRHQVKSDPTPFGLRGWSKTSNPPEAPEDNDGWSSAEEPVNSSDAEEEGRAGLRKLVPGKYTVTGLDEKGGPDALVLRSGDEVELVQEGDEGLWFVRNVSSGGEGWLPARNLSALLGQRGAPGCLSSPAQALRRRRGRGRGRGRGQDARQPLACLSAESSAGSALLSASSSCSESCAAALADLQG
ncbi:hypothetical protein EI555_001080 [Monodon monoceros]|uniref:Guanine nucleotide exchange factor DBS n=1 Tax=Monodon monoceros TaxID=40151 RepID=A0A4U1F9B2_MONMO|nr:hypothetical protein EI555_001080 [Monodon monoceros]